MLQCSSSICNKQWLHLSCAGLAKAPEGDWFCSEDCKNEWGYIHCWCHERLGGEMVECQLGSNCKKHQWYHMECLLPSERPGAMGKIIRLLQTYCHVIYYWLEDVVPCKVFYPLYCTVFYPTDIWYCSEDCAAAQPGETNYEEDFVRKYSQALIWEGLNHLARRDAIREGDGPAMVDFWKMEMVTFFNRGNHKKYFINGHYMLTDKPVTKKYHSTSLWTSFTFWKMYNSSAGSPKSLRTKVTV